MICNRGCAGTEIKVAKQMASSLVITHIGEFHCLQRTNCLRGSSDNFSPEHSQLSREIIPGLLVNWLYLSLRQCLIVTTIRPRAPVARVHCHHDKTLSQA